MEFLRKFVYKICAFFSIIAVISLFAYDQPNTLNYGYTNILTGGPVRPASGWYWHQYAAYYFTDDFKDINCCGESPTFNTVWGITEFLYQTKKNYFLNARIGVELDIYYVLYSKVSKNKCDLTDNGIGFSDPYLGIYLQWDPVMRKDRAVLVHRLEFSASFPAGKYNKKFFFNPGNGFYYINPSWAGTLFFTPRLAASWNINYVWSAKNKHTGLQPGQAFLLDYSFEAEPIKKFWFAVNGYYLQQFTDSKLNGKKISGPRESVFAIGPGMLYDPEADLSAFAYLYFEKGARSYANGISAIASFILHF